MEIESIKFKNVFFAYDSSSYILRDISIEINKGDSIFIFGNSGGGKSTFLKLASGLIYPVRGSVYINDVDTKKATKPQLMEFHKKSAFIFQDSGLINNMNVYDNIALPLRYNTTKNEKEINDIIIPILKELGLLGDKLHLPSQLSRGEKKLVSIARALVINPGLFYYDFPFEGIDFIFMEKVKNIILKQKENDITILLTDNHIDFALKYFDKILVLYNGEVVFLGTPSQLLEYDHPFINHILKEKK